MRTTFLGQRCGGKAFWAIFACSVLYLSPPRDAASATFAGGTGEPNDPYQIATAAQLIAAGSDSSLLSRHFVLVADIDLDPNGPDGRVFQGALIAPGSTVVGSSGEGAPLMGTFDGQGHSIRHLTLSLVAPGGTAAGGLFDSIGQSGTVRNLVLSDLRAAVQGTAFFYFGGLAGSNAGRITCCSVSGQITVDGSSPTAAYAGGLVGRNPGTLLQCCSSAQMAGSQENLGGLAGSNEGTITDCYATGTVDTGLYRQRVGGLAAMSSGQIARCYAAGPAMPMDTFSSGGLVGLGSAGYALASYFLQEADGGGPDNGVGKALSGAQMSQQASFAFWDFYGRQTDGTEDAWFMPEQGYPVLSWQTDQTGLIAVPEVKGLPQDQAAAALARLGLGLAKINYDYAPSVPAGYVLASGPAPFVAPGSSIDLWVSLGTYDWTRNAGNGTQASPYQIGSGGQLACLHFRSDLWHSSFVLIDDLDMRQHVFPGAVIAPDQNQSDAVFQSIGFGGRLDGQGHAIRNLTITTDAWSVYVGLFGYVEPQGEIRNLRLADARVTTGPSSFYVGILTGRNLGATLDCSIQGTLLTGGNSGLIGCMTGFNEGSLTRCLVDAQLLASGRQIGGLAGVNVGQITQSAVRGSSQIGGLGQVAGGVAGTSSGGIQDSYSMLDMELLERCQAGGLVGNLRGRGSSSFSTSTTGHSISIHCEYGDGGYVRNCYAAGRMSGATSQNSTTRVGGLVGNGGSDSTVTGSFWDMESTGVHVSNAGTGLLTQQMMDPAVIGLFGWDLVDTWTICEGKDYPRLKWENVRCEQ